MSQHPDIIQRVIQGFKDTGSQFATAARFVDEQIFQHPFRAGADAVGLDVGTAIVFDAPQLIREGHPLLAGAIVAASLTPIPGAKRSVRRFADKFDSIADAMRQRHLKNTLEHRAKHEGERVMTLTNIEQVRGGIRPKAKLTPPGRLSDPPPLDFSRERGQLVALTEEGLSPQALKEATDNQLQHLTQSMNRLENVVGDFDIPHPRTVGSAATPSIDETVTNLFSGNPRSMFEDTREMLLVQKFYTDVDVEILNRVTRSGADADIVRRTFLGPGTPTPHLRDIATRPGAALNAPLELESLILMRDDLMSEQSIMDFLLNTGRGGKVR